MIRTQKGQHGVLKWYDIVLYNSYFFVLIETILSYIIIFLIVLSLFHCKEFHFTLFGNFIRLALRLLAWETSFVVSLLIICIQEQIIATILSQPSLAEFFDQQYSLEGISNAWIEEQQRRNKVSASGWQ